MIGTAGCIEEAPDAAGEVEVGSSGPDPRWRFETAGWAGSPSVVENSAGGGTPEASRSGTLYAGDVFGGGSESSLYAVSMADGTVQWRFDRDADVNSSPAVVGDTVYVGWTDNHVHALPADGE